jgi:hypothetical protein
MPACTFLFGDVGVAGFAGLMTGKVNRSGRDFVQGRSAVVAVLSEGAGYEPAADREEDEDRNDKDSRKSEEMTGIAKNLHRTLPPKGGCQEEF